MGNGNIKIINSSEHSLTVVLRNESNAMVVTHLSAGAGTGGANFGVNRIFANETESTYFFEKGEERILNLPSKTSLMSVFRAVKANKTMVLELNRIVKKGEVIVLASKTTERFVRNVSSMLDYEEFKDEWYKNEEALQLAKRKEDRKSAKVSTNNLQINTDLKAALMKNNANSRGRIETVDREIKIIFDSAGMEWTDEWREYLSQLSKSDIDQIDSDFDQSGFRSGNQ